MKKRYVILAALLVTALAAAGCGKKQTEDTGKDGQVTVAPAENTDTASSDDSSLVDMQKSDDADIKNVIGDKTSTASKLILVNGTGAAVKGLYIRPTTDDDDDWGTELINGLFTLNDGDKALYYYEPDEKDADGNAVTNYDIRITYEDEDYTDCYFRKLPLKTISKITLHMEGTVEDGIPYATYLTGTSKTETSTLSEVMARLGLDDSEDSSEDDSQETDTAPTPTSAPQQSDPTAAPTSAPQPTSTPDNNGGSNTAPNDSSADKAKQYIGQPLSSLVAALGEANGSDYENEPETGETGYHYYDSFTVSTTVDDSGNEVVAGVW